VRVPTRSVARLRVRPVEKEPWTARWLEERLRPDDVLWDVGANVGSYALIGAGLQPEAQVVAVEPEAGNYAALCENLRLNRLDGRVVALPVALAEGSRVGTLGLARPEPGAAVHRLDATGSADGVQSVLVLALDDLVGAFGLPAPTLLKIDVDGAEAEVLAGARAALAAPRLRSVLVEIDEGNGDAVVGALAEAGLPLAERVQERDGEPLPGVWYGIFTRAGTS
jgi:FkbM family methyltransferase